MSLELDLTIKLNGSLRDPDTAPLLSDAAAAYGVIRTDTAAVVVAAGAAFTRRSTGVWYYTLDPVLAGVTYQYARKVVLAGKTYYSVKTKQAAAAGAVTGGSYLGVSDARTMAAALPGLASLKAASDDALAAALLEASDRVDTAYPYQGRKYDLTPQAQLREFPRVPYETPYVAGGWPYATLPVGGVTPLPAPGVGVQVWDLDGDGNAVVPANVLKAVVFEADAVLAGDGWADAKDAQHAGLASQQIGTAAEAYRPADAAGVPLLCRRADRLMQFYILKHGRML